MRKVFNPNLKIEIISQLLIGFIFTLCFVFITTNRKMDFSVLNSNHFIYFTIHLYGSFLYLHYFCSNQKYSVFLSDSAGNKYFKSIPDFKGKFKKYFIFSEIILILLTTPLFIFIILGKCTNSHIVAIVLGYFISIMLSHSLTLKGKNINRNLFINLPFILSTNTYIEHRNNISLHISTTASLIIMTAGLILTLISLKKFALKINHLLDFENERDEYEKH